MTFKSDKQRKAVMAKLKRFDNRYRHRINSAFNKVDKLRNQVITKRINLGVKPIDAIVLTDKEKYKILRKSGGLQADGHRIVTKKDWKFYGRPIIKKVDNIGQFKVWKELIK